MDSKTRVRSNDGIDGKDSVGLYLESIAKTPLLTAAEEVELARLIEVGQYAQAVLRGEVKTKTKATEEELLGIAEEGERAMQHFVRANLRLVVSVARKYGRSQMPLLDLVQERLDFAKSLGIEYVINSGKEDPVERIKEITGGEMAHQVMECSGANPAIRQTFDLVSNAGRITLTGWPKKETSLPTDVITKKEIDIRGARTSAGEFEEALDLINSRKVDMMKILTKTVTMDEAPDTIVDIEKNPGNYMKVVVRVSNDD